VKHVSERTVNAGLVEAETNCIVWKSELWMAGGRSRSPRTHHGK